MAKIKEEFYCPADYEILQSNNLETFSKLWEVELNWFEPPNYRRSGWSGAARHELRRENGEMVGVFIKRQEHHIRKTLRYPAGCPTFRIEWQNYKKLTNLRIGVPRLLYYGEHESRAILITYELDGFSSLEEWFRGNQSPQLCHAVFSAITDVVRRFHDHRFRNNSLYPKHIMLKVRQDGNLNAIDVRLIDLEKSRRVFFAVGARIRDLCTLLRHCEWTSHEKDLFLNCYLKAGLEHLPPKQLAERLWKFPLVKWVKRRIAAREKDTV
jgi:hypothetical protein